MVQLSNIQIYLIYKEYKSNFIETKIFFLFPMHKKLTLFIELYKKIICGI